jgi:predicted NAD/FAD-binding protein
MSENPAENTVDIAAHIVAVRNQRVLLDTTLATLYGVSTKALNQAVRRNRQRFPEDFLFELSSYEWSSLRSQYAILEKGWGRHRKYSPLAFTEHGAIMAATILNSPRAIQMSVYVVRAFVRFRRSLVTHTDLSRELELLKRSVATLDADTRRQFDQVYEAILGLMAAPPKKQ